MNLLTLSNVDLMRGERMVLQQVNLDVRSGEMLGLIGANGAGKTTLLKAMAGLIQPSHGEILWQNGALSRDASWRARWMAYMGQGVICHWPVPVEEVVALGRLPHRGFFQSVSGSDRAVMDRAMQEADIAHLRTRSATEISAGETARLMLARALASEPKLLLADEPVSGIDPAHQLSLMQLLRGKVDTGLGMVLALHDLTLAARFCDRIAVLHDRGILALGSPREVLTPDCLKTVLSIEALNGEHENTSYYVPWRCLTS